MRNSYTLKSTLGFALALLFLGFFFMPVRAEAPAIANREISPIKIPHSQGGKLTIKVTIEVNEKINGLILDEDLPEGWEFLSQTSSGEPAFKESKLQWLWLKASEGSTVTVEYEVSVPSGEDYGTYLVAGIIKSGSPELEATVGGDEDVIVPAVEVTRDIESPQVVKGPGGSTKVTVTITPKTDIDGLSLDEDLKGFPDDWGNWEVTEVQSAEGTFKQDTVAWLWMKAKEGKTKTVIYEVSVPESAEEGSYPISGEMKSMQPVFSQPVEPKEKEDSAIEVVDCFSIPYVVSHWQDGKVDPEDDPTIEMPEILTAIRWWADGTEVPRSCCKVIDTDTILQLITYWANGKPINKQTAGERSEKMENSYIENPVLTFSDTTINPTETITAHLTFGTSTNIDGLSLNFDLPAGFKLIPKDNADSTYKESTSEYLWLSVGQGETKSMGYELSPKENIEPGKYELTANLESNSPHFEMSLPGKKITVTPVPKLSLSKISVYPNPVTTKESVKFVAQGQGITSTTLEIFSPSGAPVYRKTESSNKVVWDLSGEHGDKVSNGIYLYKLKVTGSEKTIVSDVKKVVVLG